MKITSLTDLLTVELQDLYSVENQILEAAPKLEEASTNKELKKTFKDHIKETEKQALRLEKIAKQLDIDLDGKTCEGMKGIIKEEVKVAKMDIDSTLKDIAIIGDTRKVEHYEIVGYTAAIEMARLLGLTPIVKLLKETLAEEKNSDKLLAKISKTSIDMKSIIATA